MTQVSSRATSAGLPGSATGPRELREGADDARLMASMLLPPDDRLLVRVIEGAPAGARAAWSSWTKQAGAWTDPRTSAGRLAKGLAPAIADAIARHDLDVDRDAMTALRAWRLADTERQARYDAILHDVVWALDRAGVESLLVGGAVFAALADDARPARHCHDIDVLVGSSGVARAIDAIAAEGFSARRSDEWRTHLAHGSGLPLVLRHGVVHAHPHAAGFAELSAVARDVRVAGRGARSLAPGHALVLACLPAFLARHRVEAARALVDAARLVPRMQDADWASALDVAARHDLAGLLLATLRAVADDTGREVPARVVRQLTNTSAPSQARRVLPLLAGAPRTLAALRATPLDRYTRLRVAAMMLVPPKECVATAGESLAGMSLAMRYVARAARWCVRRPVEA